MSLQRKFVVLLLVMALAVLMNLGLALWTLGFAQSELVRPLLDIRTVLPSLGSIKQSITLQAAVLGGNPDSGGFPFPDKPEASAERGDDARARFDAARAEVARQLALLEGLDRYTTLVGISTSRNLHARVESAERQGTRWFQTRDEPDRRDAIAQYKSVHDLIERMEGSVAQTASEGTDYAGRFRSNLLLDLLASIAIVVLTTALGVIFLRRWVARPVGLLREAADRLAKGEFSHRVPVSTNDELGQLSAEVNHMAGMISAMQEERVDRERLAAAGEVVRRLAHNLRNPLAGIRSLAELTRADLAADAPARENQDRILQTVDRFERWLSGMLSATTPLTLVPQTLPIAPWLTALVEPLHPAAAAKGVTIQVQTAHAPAKAVFDPRHLEQAVVGIITNALQVSTKGDTILVEATADGRDAAHWEISVADQGPGVPPDIADKIFRPYFTTKRDGTGIGLAVAKQVAEQHAGRIGVHPAHGSPNGAESRVGARFILSLPLAGPGVLANTGQ